MSYSKSQSSRLHTNCTISNEIYANEDNEDTVIRKVGRRSTTRWRYKNRTQYIMCQRVWLSATSSPQCSGAAYHVKFHPRIIKSCRLPRKYRSQTAIIRLKNDLYSRPIELNLIKTSSYLSGTCTLSLPTDPDVACKDWPCRRLATTRRYCASFQAVLSTVSPLCKCFRRHLS